jgi:hypothetical protein
MSAGMLCAALIQHDDLRNGDIRLRAPNVVEIVAVKASSNHSEPQLSAIWPQRIQSKAVIFTLFLQASISGETWFGTMVSTFYKPYKIIYLQN